MRTEESVFVKRQSFLQAKHVGARSGASLVTLCSCNRLGGKTSGLEGQPEKSLAHFSIAHFFFKLRSPCLSPPGGIVIAVSRKGQNVYMIHFTGWVTSLRSGQM